MLESLCQEDVLELRRAVRAVAPTSEPNVAILGRMSKKYIDKDIKNPEPVAKSLSSEKGFFALGLNVPGQRRKHHQRNQLYSLYQI